jgi:hypothetical protein
LFPCIFRRCLRLKAACAKSNAHWFASPPQFPTPRVGTRSRIEGLNVVVWRRCHQCRIVAMIRATPAAGLGRRGRSGKDGARQAGLGVAPRTHSQRKLGPQVPTRRIYQQLSRIVCSKATPSALSFSNRFPRRPGVCQPELGAAVRLRPLPLVQALQTRIDSSKCSLELARDFHGGLSRVQHLNELFSSRSVQRGAEGRGPVIVRPPDAAFVLGFC